MLSDASIKLDRELFDKYSVDGEFVAQNFFRLASKYQLRKEAGLPAFELPPAPWEKIQAFYQTNKDYFAKNNLTWLKIAGDLQHDKDFTSDEFCSEFEGPFMFTWDTVEAYFLAKYFASLDDCPQDVKENSAWEAIDRMTALSAISPDVIEEARGSVTYHVNAEVTKKVLG